MMLRVLHWPSASAPLGVIRLWSKSSLERVVRMLSPARRVYRNIDTYMASVFYYY